MIQDNQSRIVFQLCILYLETLNALKVLIALSSFGNGTGAANVSKSFSDSHLHLCNVLHTN